MCLAEQRLEGGRDLLNQYQQFKYQVIKTKSLYQISVYTITTRKDIYPSEGLSLDVGARFDESDACYGWNDEAYFSHPTWRNPKRILPPGRYIVKVELTSAADKATNYYRLINDTGVTSFRLEPAQPVDIKNLDSRISPTAQTPGIHFSVLLIKPCKHQGDCHV